MAFLERNLEQLTHVQRQLVEQNGSLKKEVAIADRKLSARNDRIGSLEVLLSDSQEKLTAANHRYISSPCPNNLSPRRCLPITPTDSIPHRFEAQLTAVKERLEAAKVSTRGVSALANTSNSAFNFGAAGSRHRQNPSVGGGGKRVRQRGTSNLTSLPSAISKRKRRMVFLEAGRRGEENQLVFRPGG